MEFLRIMLGLVLLVGLIALYFLPSIIANNRNHKNTEAITVLNLLTGWTFLGWIICLIWAIIK